MATQIEFDRHHNQARDADRVFDFINASVCSMKYGKTQSDGANPGLTMLRGVMLPGIGVFRSDGIGCLRVQRTRQHIVNDAGSDFIVSIPLFQRTVLSQSSVVTSCEPGTFRLISTAIPFSCEGRASGPRDKRAELFARIPGARLRQLFPTIDSMSNIPIEIRHGAGQVMKAMLELALAEGAALTDAQAGRMGETILHGIVDAIRDAPECRKDESLLHSSPLARVRETAKNYILKNLANPNLGGASIAGHCQVSERYLYRAFAEEPTGLSAYIRELRLQGCRKAIIDPVSITRPVFGIAMDWGFSDAASFNRVYKARFGISPGRERHSGKHEIH